MASSVIGQLRVALSLGTAEFESGANKAAAIAKTKAKEIEGAFSGAKAAVSGLFAAFTVGLLAEQVKKSLEYAGSLAEVSRTLGVTTKDLQTFRFAATQSGVAQDQLEVGLRRLTVSMGKAELGSKAQAKAFGAIGISVDQLKGKNTGDVFRLMADGLSKVTDRSQRAAIEMTLMGRSGSTLDNLLAPGSKRLNELADAAQRLGIVLSDSQIQGAEETAHKLEAVKMVLSAQIAGVVADNAGAILSLSSALASLTGSIIKFLGSNPQLALGIIGGLLGGRVGGLPGAAVGVVAGAVAGSYIHDAADKSNMDLAYRGQQLAAAHREFQAAQGFGVSNVERHAAQQKLIEQTNLANQAAALAVKNRHSGPPVATGTDLPQFLGGGGKGRRPKKAPEDKSADEEFQVAQQQRQIDLQILSAKQSLSHDIGQQAELSLQQLDVQKAITNADLDHKLEQAARDLAEHKITAEAYKQIVADVATTRGKENTVDGLKRQAVLDDRDERLLRESIDLDTHGYDLKKEQLQKQADLATSMSERRAIELQILDLSYKEKRIMLDRIIAESKNADEVDKARQDRLALDKNYSLDRQGVLKSTAGPLEQYLNSLPTTSAKWTEALQGVAVDGFGRIESAADSLAGKIVKVGGVFGDVTRTIIADLLKIELQKLVIAPLANLLGSVLGGGGGGFNFGSLGASASVSSGLLSFANPVASAPGFASGGSLLLGGNPGTDRNTLALNGIPIARVGMGETLSVDPNGGRGGGNVYQTIAPNFAGNAATKDDLMQMAILTKQAAISAINEKNRRR